MKKVALVTCDGDWDSEQYRDSVLRKLGNFVEESKGKTLLITVEEVTEIESLKEVDYDD